MYRTVKQSGGLAGTVQVPPDKSIAHRAALLAAVAEGTSRLINYSPAADPQSTLSCLRALGIEILEEAHGILAVHGSGLDGFAAPAAPLDCGNSGTTMRLLAGLLARRPFASILTGDESLSSRPMTRITEPLLQMGARIDLSDGHAPMHIHPVNRLNGIEYHLPVASAQVKSCVLLAGLLADGETTVVETHPSRDHTERMMGLDVVEFDGKQRITVTGGTAVKPGIWHIPGDFSAAAFFLVAGCIVPDSEITVENVGLNPTRSALVDVLRSMGADIQTRNERTVSGEPIADLKVRTSELSGVTIGGSLIPVLIDEIPVLAVAATCAEGETLIRDAQELRVKETDRLSAVALNLLAMGADVEEFEDGLLIRSGKRLRGAEVHTYHDHRIAMAMAVAGLVAEGETTIDDADCVRVSFPGFWEELERLS